MIPEQTVSTTRLAFVIFLAILLIGILGTYAVTHPHVAILQSLNLDRELNFVTFFSGLLIFNAGWILLRGKMGARKLPPPISFLGFLFVFMAADECLKIHETLEKWAGVDWQILYLPIIVAAGLGWLRTLAVFQCKARILWFFGALAWGSSQLFEAAQWGWWSDDDAVEGYLPMMIAEEILEMLGSAFFLLAIYSETIRHQISPSRQIQTESRRARRASLSINTPAR